MNRQYQSIMILAAMVLITIAATARADNPTCSLLYVYTGTSYDELGWSVSGAGDFNNDGYGDVIIGAPGPNNRAFIYSGSDGSLLCEIINEGDDDDFGISVSDVGDINKDGYGDVLVGAPFNDAGGTDAGRVYLFWGSSGSFPVTLSAANANLILTGETAGVEFGISVSGTGDFNGDGYPDFIIGASKDAGKAYIFSGLTGLVLLTISGETSSDHFGRYLSDAGDFNNDGYSDVIIGAPDNDAGRAYLFLGGPGPYPLTKDAANADLIIVGEASGDKFSQNVSNAGDINNDGFGDLIIGAVWNDAGGHDGGRAYIFYGYNILSQDVLPAADADWIITAEGGNNEFGDYVSNAGDINLDGFGDFIIGADGAAGQIGHAYIFLGRDGSGPFSLSASNAYLCLTGEGAADEFGTVSDAGDVNDDGIIDLIIGAPYYQGGGRNGRAYVYAMVHHDLLYSPSIQSFDSELVVPLRFCCQTPTAAYQVSLCWEPADFELKSVSFAGTAVDSWGFKGQIIDNENQNVLIYAAVGQDFDYILTGEDTVLAYLHFANPLNTYDSVCILEPFTSTDSLALVLDTCTINGDGLLFGDTTTDPGPVPFYPYIAFDTSWAYSYPDYSYIPGDVNCDQAVNLIDILYLINYKYKNPPGPAPMPPSSGDVNADCDINLLDILYFIDYKYGTPAGPELLCGCVESSPLNKIGSTIQKYSDAPYGGEISTEYADGKTFIKLDAADVIKGIEMEIRLPDISANVSCPIEGMQVYSRQENDMIKLALFDINGQHQIDKGEIILLEIDGEAEIVSAFAGGMNAEPLYLEIAGNNTDSPQLPDKFALHQNHPNPFNPVTQISFELPVEAHVTLDVYNIMGQKVSTIADRRFAPGYHTVEWDGSSFASGVYFYRIQAGDAIETRKMMLLK